MKDTPLILALENGYESLSVILIEMGANLKIMGRNCQTPIMIACDKNLTKAVELMAQLDSSIINDKNILGETPLKIAERKGNLNLVQFLMSFSNKSNSRLPTANSQNSSLTNSVKLKK